ncbi:MAG: L-seryl-tRNA(Sec) selenium transferase [Actinomycetota bacterium]|nr:L-seryl-tRNA(Sec) selenium transferase [Actinomycetota bacterium]
MDIQETLRRLPKVDEALKHPLVTAALEAHPRQLVLDALRETIESARARVLAGHEIDLAEETLVREAIALLALKAQRSLRRVVNATGVIVHTNLGRSVLSAEATAAVAEIASGYSTLEYDIEGGERGSRHVHVEGLICRLTGAEAAMAVNNNAAAVMLGIAALARGGEAIVSRGQLVEIGGSFRIPDIMAESGAKMVEVGTTNKTHLRDYEVAITPETRLLLKVHSSNFRVVGFTEEVTLGQLVELGAPHGIPVFEDQGSGVLVDLRKWGLPYEPTVGESIAQGAALVSCSGDKLLGGPQAGLLAGRHDIISRLKAHPMARALRLDKMTLAALEVTLRAYLDPARAARDIPTLAMLSAPVSEVRERAGALAGAIAAACGERLGVELADGASRAGGGALPTADIPTVVVAITPREIGVVELESRLRLGEPCVVARIAEDRLLLDARTLLPGEGEIVAAALAAAVGA